MRSWRYYRILKDDSAIYMFCSWHHIEFFKTEPVEVFQSKTYLVMGIKNNHGSEAICVDQYAPKCQNGFIRSIKG